MTMWEFTFNIVAAGTTVALLLFVRHLLKSNGRDRLNDAELVKQFRETAPYHLLDDLYAGKK